MVVALLAVWLVFAPLQGPGTAVSSTAGGAGAEAGPLAGWPTLLGLSGGEIAAQDSLAGAAVRFVIADEPIGAEEEVEEEDPLPQVVARFDGLEVRLPGERILYAGFHEAYTVNGLPMMPVGRLIAHRNTTKFDAPPDDPEGPDYLIMASRGRPTPATSALDVLMELDEPVLAPVSGVVAEVRGFQLEGRYPDLRIELHPDDHPDLRVVVIHVDGVRVQAGDRVEAGVTVIADTARQFPFLSQIDNETYPDLHPHVHLEVQRREAGRPGASPDTDEAVESAGGEGG